MSIRFTITGFVREAESGIGIPGLFVKAYDKDLLFDDLLGTAITNADGSFEIVSESGDFREFFDVKPDIYLRVLGVDRVTEIWSSEEAVRWNAGRYEEFDVRVPREKAGAEVLRSLWSRTEVSRKLRHSPESRSSFVLPDSVPQRYIPRRSATTMARS
jgi:hypothetical protein